MEKLLEKLIYFLKMGIHFQNCFYDTDLKLEFFEIVIKFTVDGFFLKFLYTQRNKLQRT